MGVVDHKVSLVSGYENSRRFRSCVIHRRPVQGHGFINTFLFPNGDFLKWHEMQRVCSRKRLTVRKKAHASSHVYSLRNDMLVYFFKLIVLPLSSIISYPKRVTVQSLGRDPSHHLTHAEMNRQDRHLLDCGWEIVQVVTLSSHWLFTSTRKILLHFHSFENYNGTRFLFKAFVLTHRAL